MPSVLPVEEDIAYDLVCIHIDEGRKTLWPCVLTMIKFDAIE